MLPTQQLALGHSAPGQEAVGQALVHRVQTEWGPSVLSRVTSISFAVVDGAELVCELADIMQRP